MGPRLTYGLWFEPERNLVAVTPPPDIMPYLEEAAKTFAGILFWRTLTTVFSIIRTAHDRLN